MDRLLKLIEWVVIGMVAFITVLVAAEVALRGLFSFPLIITEEASRYLMIWIAMLGAALVTAEDGHIRLDFLPQGLSPKAKLAFRQASQLCVLLFLGVLSVTTMRILPELTQDRTVTLGLSMAWIYAALPVGGVLMMILTVRNMARDWRGVPVAAVRSDR